MSDHNKGLAEGFSEVNGKKDVLCQSQRVRANPQVTQRAVGAPSNIAWQVLRNPTSPLKYPTVSLLCPVRPTAILFPSSYQLTKFWLTLLKALSGPFNGPSFSDLRAWVIGIDAVIYCSFDFVNLGV